MHHTIQMKPLLICIVFCILQNTIQNTYVFNLIKYSKNCISTIFLISDKKKFEKPIRYICVHICGHICIHVYRIRIFDQELILSCFKSKIHFFRFKNMCVHICVLCTHMYPCVSHGGFLLTFDCQPVTLCFFERVNLDEHFLYIS